MNMQVSQIIFFSVRSIWYNNSNYSLLLVFLIFFIHMLKNYTMSKEYLMQHTQLQSGVNQEAS